MATIYRIRNTINGDFYIGKTIQRLQRRYSAHLSNAARGTETHLYRAIRKYGPGAFVCEMIENVEDHRNLNAREQHWISELSPPYNMTIGGDGGDVSGSPEYIRAMKDRRSYEKSGNPMFGKKGENNPNFGQKRSEDQKRRMRAGIQRAWDGNTNRRQAASDRVMGFENNPGARANAKRIEFDGAEYVSLADASRKTGRSLDYIRKKGVFIDVGDAVV